jgi:hypothetical protein
MLVAIGVAGALCTAALPPAAAQAAPDIGCAQPLDACTKERTAALNAVARKFTAAARMKPTATLTAEERAKVQAYDRWLRAQSQQARALAERGTAATTAAIQTAFNHEYLELKRRIEREHRQFAEISNIIKAKHDAASSAIASMR